MATFAHGGDLSSGPVDPQKSDVATKSLEKIVPALTDTRINRKGDYYFTLARRMLASQAEGRGVELADSGYYYQTRSYPNVCPNAVFEV